jgi:hypothetical protein
MMGSGLDIRHSAEFEVNIYPNLFQQKFDQVIYFNNQIKPDTNMSNVKP